jgi:hypothetical protein
MRSGVSGSVASPALRRAINSDRGALIGTAVVAYLLAFGRWGSHVNVVVDQLYVTDILLVFSAVAWWRAGGRPSTVLQAPLATLVVLAIPVLAVLRFAAGADFTIDGLRDLAPYLYAVVVVFPLVPRPTDAAHRTYRVLRGALILHLALVTFALVFPSLVAGLPQVTPPGPESRMLSIRPDFASACFSVLVVSAAVRISRSTHHGAARMRWLATELALLVWSVAVILRLGARSGLLALMVAGVFVAVEFLPRFLALRRRTRVALVLVAVLALVFGAPRLNAFERLGQTVQAFGIGVDPDNPPPDATGTAHARLEAWRKTLDYTNETVGRRVVGVGFGPNFLRSSGSESVLSGTDPTGAPLYTGVRAPHNYLLNTYARMGAAGLLLVIVVLCWVLLASIRLVRRRDFEFDTLAVSLLMALGVVSMFGVILESPFGAIPFWWTAGWILARRIPA